MPEVSSVADILDLDRDDTIKRFDAKIVKMFPPKTGKNNKGEWSFQHLTCQDSQGDEIKVTLKDRDELPSSFKGKQVTFIAHQGKNGWTGLYAKDDDYKDKENPERILWVTATAEIVKSGFRDKDGDGDGDREERGREREERGRDRDDRHERHDREERRDRDRDRHEDREEREDREEHEERRREEPKGDPIDDTKERLCQLSNLAAMCYDVATYTLHGHEHRNNCTVAPDAIDKMAVTFFIKLDREGLADNMPTEPIYDEKGDAPGEDPDPEPDAEPEPKSKSKRR